MFETEVQFRHRSIRGMKAIVGVLTKFRLRWKCSVHRRYDVHGILQNGNHFRILDRSYFPRFVDTGKNQPNDEQNHHKDGYQLQENLLL